MLPDYKFKKIKGGYIVKCLLGSKKDDHWLVLCTLGGSRGKWYVSSSTKQTTFQTRWKAAAAYAKEHCFLPYERGNADILKWWKTQDHKRDLITEEIANEIYDILIKNCGARKDDRDSFVHHHTTSLRSTEYRFSGRIGFGGKFRNHAGWWVDCYPEDQNYNTMFAIIETNVLLQALWYKHIAVNR